MDLPAIWFGLLGGLLIGYAILDGFDLGAGILHPLARTDQERRIFLNAIGPLWDGNEVWLITFGGALFAAFPLVYAAVFSGFYLPFMLLLLALIFRAVSIEFRGKRESPAWQRTWDCGFCAASLIASFAFGFAVGNAMIGIPLDASGNFAGNLADLIGLYPILTGLLTVAMFAMHGTIFLYLKTPEGDLAKRLREWMWHTWGAFLALYMLVTISTLIWVPHAEANFHRAPETLLIVIADVLAIANIPRSIYRGRAFQAFLSSAAAIAGLIVIFGLALWPNLVTARNDPSLSLTIHNAASSPKTLGIMLVIAAIGMPFILAYTAGIYWTFRGKVRLEQKGY